MKHNSMASLGASRRLVLLLLCLGGVARGEPTAEARIAAGRLAQFAASAERSEENKLVLVYFTPADREPPPGCRERLARVMGDIRDFFGREMDRHGLGWRSIRFDLDATGALIVHEVRGRHPAAHYLGRDSRKGYEIKSETKPVLAAAGIDDDKATVIYFCHLRTEQDGRTTGIGPYYGSGAQTGAFRWGRCWFTDATILDPDRLADRTTMLNDEEYGSISVGRYNSIFIGGAAHELGHGLGLPHDKERKDEAGRGASVRFVVCHLNGATSSFRYPLQVNDDGRPDANTFAAKSGGGSLMVCGMDEVFVIDADAATGGSIAKLWSWRAKDHSELPEDIRRSFATTDDCKPVDGGRKVLLSASSGGCALVERPSGRVVWHARVPNAHSLEALPRERVVVASSVGAKGNRLVVFDLAHSDQPICDTPLPSAHGVVWDEARHCLWALGFKELRCYELKDWESDKPALVLRASHPLQDEDGHDLQPVPGSNNLALSTSRHVYLFDRDRHEFLLHPDLGSKEHVKCVSVHPTTGRAVFIQGGDKDWWSNAINFLAPSREIKLLHEHLYKARWLPNP